MSKEIIQLNEGAIKEELRELVRGSVEETLNSLLEKEAQELTQAARYERTQSRQGYRSGHYDRSLTTTSGNVSLRMPRLKGVPFETAIIERYRRRESSVEEALIEMYLAGVSVRRVEDITEALWGAKVSPSTISELNKKAYVHIEDWRNRQLKGGTYPYVYVDGIYLRRNWGGEFENVSILVAIGVNEDGYREVIGAAEGMKEDKASWLAFLQWLKGRGLDGVRLIVGDKCLGMLEAAAEVFPQAKYQRCTVHFYRNVFSVTPRGKMKLVAKMLKAIHAQESKTAAREKARQVAADLREMKLPEAARKVEDSIAETLAYMEFPYEHWLRIRTNNVIERLNREIRRRTRVVGTFPDGNSALMLVCARLRHVAGTQSAAFARADSNGTINRVSGIYANLTAAFVYSNIGTNAITAKAYYKEVGTGTWLPAGGAAVTITGTAPNMSGTVTYGTGGIVTTKLYDVKVTLADAYSTIETANIIPTVARVFDLKNDRAAFGGIATIANALQVPVGWTLYANGNKEVFHDGRTIPIANGGTGATTSRTNRRW